MSPIAYCRSVTSIEFSDVWYRFIIICSNVLSLLSPPHNGSGRNCFALKFTRYDMSV